MFISMRHTVHSVQVRAITSAWDRDILCTEFRSRGGSFARGRRKEDRGLVVSYRRSLPIVVVEGYARALLQQRPQPQDLLRGLSQLGL